jgi:hypothetical protein
MRRAVLWLLAVLLLAGCAVPAAVREEDDAIKVQLLMDAMDEVGVCRPEQAVDVWARGLMERSAAMQYAVMTGSLREKYVESLAKNVPNWVTGLSSPWVSGYTVEQVREPAPNRRVYTVSVKTETSTGPAGKYRAVLALREKNGFWRISGISADDELSVYTGF